jgi:hypothetical protein
MKIKNNINFFELIIIFLSVVLVVSYKSTLLEMFSDEGGKDLIFYPIINCISQGINHYRSALDGNSCAGPFSHMGEYLQSIYLILYPFKFLEVSQAKILWGIINFFLIFLITFLLCKKFKLDKFSTVILIFFISFSIITRIHLIMGQNALFILFFLILPFIFKSKLSFFLSGLSYAKYNIGYTLFLYYIANKKFKILLISILPCLFGWFFYSFLTDKNFTSNIFEPFLLMLHLEKNPGNKSNLIFLFSFILKKEFFIYPFNLIFFIFASLFINYFIIIKISKIHDDLLKLSCLNISALIFMPHYSHDYIILIPFIIYSVKNYGKDFILSRVNLLSCIYFLHLQGVKQFLNLGFDFQYLNILLLSLLLIFNLKQKKTPDF